MVEIPAAFEKLLKKKRLMQFFGGIELHASKKYWRWISEARKKEARMKRLAAVVAILKKGVRTPE